MYLDIRSFDSTEKASLDISRHLPARTRVGPVAIITERPAVFFSVLRKRWSKIVGEVRRQRASTLDKRKKNGLYNELCLLERLTFSLITKQPSADIVFADLHDMPLLSKYYTIYIYTDPDPTPQEIKLLAREHLHPNGLITAYTHDADLYIKNLCQTRF
ncbi:MAG TPA: hypothetical protein VF733_03550 [Candidatus Saccharimonadales bacterium]